MHRVDVKARAALIRMIRVFLRPEHAIFDDEKSEIQKRTRVGARAQVATDSEAAFRIQIAAQSEISRPAERQVVSFRNAKAFLARSAERRCQESGRAIAMLD